MKPDNSLTPTWTDALPYILKAIETGTYEAREVAYAQLYRMATVADKGVTLIDQAIEAAHEGGVQQ